MTTIVVCGGRSYGLVPDHIPDGLRLQYEAAAERERGRLVAVLDAAVARLELSRLACGDATGADALAAAWAESKDIPFKVYVADWPAFGNAAGPKRNGVMLKEEQPSAVIAFPGSRGTRDCCRQAEKLGITVYKVDWS